MGTISTDKIFSGVLQTIIAGAAIWMATSINSLSVKLAAMQERINALEVVPGKVDELHLSQEEIKMRLIRVEDNQHKNNLSKN